ncbi:hypothetical protein D3C75_470600 [compost metagenome]
MNSLISFIQTGNLGEILIGMERKTIEDLLGTPQDISISKKPTIVKYGSIQLSFPSDKSNEKLDSIHIYFDEAIEFPKQLQLEGWLPNNGIGLQEFVGDTKIFNIKLIEDKKHTFKNLQIGLKSEVGVIIIFNIEEGLEKLNSMHLSEL